MTDNNEELTPGMSAHYDQMLATYGNFVDAVGFFYTQLRKWNIREEYAIQLAARFQQHLEGMWVAQASESALERILAESTESKSAKGNA